MSHNIEIKTFTCIFLFFIRTHNISMQQFDTKTDTDKHETNDITKGLSDAEIDMALSDLSLSDLNVLTKLIDNPNEVDYYYDDDNAYVRRNQKYRMNKQDNEEQPLDDLALENYYDDIDEQALRDVHHSPHFKIPREALAFIEQTEIQRRKRENTQQQQQIAVDAEYIKQLENSFPRDQEQNNHEDSDDKKEHVRVKRN